MDKIKAVLDQETWVEADVHDEFQAIAASFYFEEPVGDGVMDGNLSSTAGGEKETVSSNTVSVIADGQVTKSVQPSDKTDSTEVSPDTSTQVDVSSSTKPIDSNRTDVTLSAPNNSAIRTISFRGVEYHMVNWYVFSIAPPFQLDSEIFPDFSSLSSYRLFPNCLFALEMSCSCPL